MKTLAFQASRSRNRPFVVLIHTTEAPDSAEWHAYVQALDAVLTDARETVHVFVATDGGGPDAAQRRELAEVVARDSRDALTHVFTTNPLVRGIVTAFRWIARASAVAHAPSEFPGVCADCGLVAGDVLESLVKLRASFAPVRHVELIEASMRPPSS